MGSLIVNGFTNAVAVRAEAHLGSLALPVVFLGLGQPATFLPAALCHGAASAAHAAVYLGHLGSDHRGCGCGVAGGW